MAMARTRNQPDAVTWIAPSSSATSPDAAMLAQRLELRREVVLHAHAVSPLDGRELHVGPGTSAP